MAGNGDNMKNDHQYAEVLEMMRSQGAKDNPTLAQLGVMQSSNSVKIDDLVLNAEDLYIADYLVAGYTRQIKVPYVSGVSVDTTQSNSEVRRYMEECLFENEHITGVQDLEVSQIKDVLHIKFTLVTDVGSKEVEMDV